MLTGEREHHLFLVRIWREPSASDNTWRGSANHVPSGRSIVSADLDEITDFIRVRLAAGVDPAAAGAGEASRT
jgi:hypothetical protein